LGADLQGVCTPSIFCVLQPNSVTQLNHGARSRNWPGPRHAWTAETAGFGRFNSTSNSAKVHCRSVVRNCYPNKLPLKELSPRTDAQCVTSEKRDYRRQVGARVRGAKRTSKLLRRMRLARGGLGKFAGAVAITAARLLAMGWAIRFLAQRGFHPSRPTRGCPSPHPQWRQFPASTRPTSSGWSFIHCWIGPSFFVMLFPFPVLQFLAHR
jgi:hypothetical protein